MAPRIHFDPVPGITAGVMSVKCECGWEVVVIHPEESIAVMQMVFFHITQVHQIELPTICFFWH